MRKPFRPARFFAPLPSLLSLLAAVPLLYGCGGNTPDGPSILLVTFDTTRADHLGCYGYPKDTSPRIDELARDGVLYENAYAVSSWTLPAHASLFTGKFPSSHGARYNPEGKINLVMEGGIAGNPAWEAYRANTIAKNEITLAQILTDQGYATKGIIGGPWMKAVFGMNKGFLEYDDRNFRKVPGTGELNGRSAEDITDSAIAFVDEQGDKPFFLFLNYYDPHAPYMPSQAYLSQFWPGPAPSRELQQGNWDWILALYDAEIKYTDEHFGRLLDHLRARGLYDDMWILLTADHGELMGEGNMGGHGDSLSEPEIHIPLIVKEPGPDAPRGRNATFVQQVDLMPTLLDRLGLPAPPAMQGRSIYSNEHPIVAEVYPLPLMNDARSKPWRQLGDWRTLREGKWKFVWGGNGKHLLFDIEADRYEYDNLIKDHPDVAARMQKSVEDYFAGLPKPGDAMDVEISAEDLDNLSNAGYIGGGGDDEEEEEEGTSPPSTGD